MKKKGFSVNLGGGNSVNQGSGKDFYRKGDSVKRSGRFSEPPDSEKLLSSSPSRKPAPATPQNRQLLFGRLTENCLHVWVGGVLERHSNHSPKQCIRSCIEQLLMGSFLMGSLRKVLANLRGRAKTLEITVPKSRKKGLSYKCANYPCRNYPLTSARM